MAKFQLEEGEKLLWESHMAFHKKRGIFRSQQVAGKIYITDRRVCHYAMMIGTANMSLRMEEIEGVQLSFPAFHPPQGEDLRKERRELSVYQFLGQKTGRTAQKGRSERAIRPPRPGP